jgi:2-polyprenyl-3-methyl-5-hydroxy-6-metoxy-1,4-benzoquinol methylase
MLSDVSAILTEHKIDAEQDSLPLGIHFELESLDVLNMSEEHHYWSEVRRSLIRRIVKRYIQPPFEFLDIGCGNGSLLRALEHAFPGSHATGVDGYLEALINCRKRTQTAKLVLQDLARDKWQEFNRTYNVVTLLDVLEHLDRPDSVLRHVHGLLKENGILIVSVPAHQWLWSERDVFLGHRKRYNKKTLTQLLQSSGYEVLHVSHLFSYLALPALLHRKIIPGIFRTSGKNIEERELRKVPIVNDVMTIVGKLEAALSVSLPLPIGTSVYAIARRAAS